MIKVLFFASLRDQLGVSEVQLSSEENPDLDSILMNLQAQGEPWASALNNKHLMKAVNQSVAPTNRAVKDGDEVAFFPVVTGG